jgi:capsular polysaccharide transport system permease protein
MPGPQPPADGSQPAPGPARPVLLRPIPAAVPGPVIAPPRPISAAAPKLAAKPASAPPPGVRPPVKAARLRLRHALLALSFLVCVVLPASLAAAYLWGRAADQYASTVGFSVRREEGGSAIELLGGLTSISGTSSSDTDILFEFLQSQRLVTDLDARLNLREIWSKAADDPFFAFEGESVEDLVEYWERMVEVAYDKASGLIEVRVLAFDPDDAQRIAAALFDASAKMINELSAIAREDSIRYARTDLDESIERLKVAREAVTAFRNRHQLVDPRIELQNQGGLLGTLQAQLAAALIEQDLLRDTTRPDDPRLTQAQRRIEVIEARIAAERGKVGLVGSGGALGTGGGDAFASLVGEYERLSVDLEFAERTYVATLAAYDAALAEARRKSRYLAAYAQPTRAETSRFPERGTLFGLLALFLFLAWAIVVLVAYALKDRR